MPEYKDQTGRNIVLHKTPGRIVSLVPSQTELLYDLGLDTEVAGITKFCVHPEEWFRNKQRIGGTKEIKMDIIHRLNPDLIIANKEENVKEQIDELAIHYPVWVSDVHNPETAYEMIRQIGLMTGKKKQSNDLITRIRKNFSELHTPDAGYRTAYLIWKNPYMTAGGDTFIHSMMKAAGFDNMFSQQTRYPEISIEELKNARCELLLLSSEPFPFKQKHIEELQPLLPETSIILADGQMFSWYGSRLLYAPAYFQQLYQSIKIMRP